MLNNTLPELSFLELLSGLRLSSTSQTAQETTPIVLPSYCEICFSIICEAPETTAKKLNKHGNTKILSNHKCNNITLYERAKMFRKFALVNSFLQQQKSDENIELRELA